MKKEKLLNFNLHRIYLLSIFFAANMAFVLLPIENVLAAADSDLSLSPASITNAVIGTPFTLDAVVDTGVNLVNGVTVNISYDPTKFHIDSITRSASFFATMGTPDLDLDLSGTAEITVYTDWGVTVNGAAVTVATFTLTPLAVTSPTSAVNITTNSLVTADAESGNVLVNRTGAVVTVINSGGTPPTLTQVTAVPSPTNDPTPSYTFSSNVVGTITYPDASCKSTANTTTIVGNNTITFDTLASGTYACPIRVEETATPANFNTITTNSFTVDVTGPIVAQVTAVTTPTNDTTPSYTFSSTEAGTVAYGGDCSSTTGGAVSAGNTTVSFAALLSGEHSNCTVTVTDALTNVSNVLAVPAFTIDATSPVVSQVTAVTTPTSDTTPSYTFNTTEAGTITYGGGCASATTTATSGDNIISFSTLASGTYNCTVRVTDTATNASNLLAVSVFTVDATAPVLSASTPSGTLAAGTTDTTASFTTNENAICSWAAASGSAFGSMTNIITSTPATSHSFAVAGLVNGGSYGYFVRCQDALSNANATDYLVSFSVSSPAVVVTTPVVSSSSSSSSHSSSKKKKKTTARSISVSKKNVKFGEVLTQRGKKFSKNAFVLLYFAKPGGGFYAPQKIKTSAAGGFVVSYKVNKPKGKYGWYVLDTVTGKKSKNSYYTVK